MNIKEIVRNDNVAEFEYYRNSQLWYKVQWMDKNLHPQELTFPLPVEDISNATFSRCERAMLLMKYIRKYLKMVENGN